MINHLQKIYFILCFFCLGCITWSTGGPDVAAVMQNSNRATFEKLNYSYSSVNPYPNVVKNVQNRLENKMKTTGLFTNVESKLAMSNTDKANYFLEIQNTGVENHWGLNGLLYLNAFLSGFSFTLWPFYFPVTEKFEFTMYKYDSKKGNYSKVYTKEYKPTMHSLAGIITIPVIWVNFLTNSSYELIDSLVEDFFQQEEWKK